MPLDTRRDDHRVVVYQVLSLDESADFEDLRAAIIGNRVTDLVAFNSFQSMVHSLSRELSESLKMRGLSTEKVGERTLEKKADLTKVTKEERSLNDQSFGLGWTIWALFLLPLIAIRYRRSKHWKWVDKEN